MNRTASTLLIGVTALAATAAGTSVAIASSAATTRPASVTAARSSYSWYHALMTSYAGTPATGSAARLAGPAGYKWMFGAGAAAPGWLTGAAAPAQVITPGADPAQVIGVLAATAPGSRVAPADAAAAATAVPAGAVVSKAANSITFTGRDVHLTALASPGGADDYLFRMAGLTNPSIRVPAGARVTIRFINGSADSASGLVILPREDAPWFMPAAAARPAFRGAAVWFLGDPTAAGLHVATMTFTAGTPGRYTYACPSPGYARSGMVGSFTVTPAA